MNNLHRELAPISTAAWAQIDEEATRTLKRYLAARRVVDVSAPHGSNCAAIGTGHVERIEGPADGVQALRRLAQPLVELRVPFQLTREAIDSVERGSDDANWDPLKDAARSIAAAEDRAVFDGYAQAAIGGIRPGARNAGMRLPTSATGYPFTIATAINQLRLAGVNGPYRLVLGTEAYSLATGGNEEGYPTVEHLQRLLEGEIVWSPAIVGGVVVTTRGGDFALDLGQDLSIGYLAHNATHVDLYLQESFTFRLLTDEAAVPLL